MRKIYLTVDTECHDIRRANQYIDGNDGKNLWGVKKILELGKELSVPINFFLDVGEAYEYGDDFVWSIVKLIHEYDQPVFFHLHPDYLSGDHSRTYLWEYTYEEKKIILKKGLDYYQKFSGKRDRVIFRAGRYGVDPDFYDILSSLGNSVLDLSYLGGPNKMCRLTFDDTGVCNKATIYKGIDLLPNTRFIAFNMFGIHRAVGLDTADATLSEFKTYIKNTKLSALVLTMHSWNFIRKWFFLPHFISGDRAMVKKFRKSVAFAQRNGFEFGNLNDYQPVYSDKDEMIDMSVGICGQLGSIFNNFVRFQKIARLNKKYFIIYACFYLVVLLSIILLLFLIVNKG